MKRIRNYILIVWLVTIGAINVSHGQGQYSIHYGDNKEAGNYKKVNGINLYYEIYGSGKPLIFLHGSGGSIRGASARIEYFKKYFKVIAV
ncbi:MAG: alpha/beta fold hydrolase, partial [Flavisolibacter sp.]